MKTFSIPQRIFKYQGFSDTTLVALEKRQLYFSDPANFNDPFDCRLHFSNAPLTSDHIRELIQREKDHHQLIPEVEGFLAGKGPQLTSSDLAEIATRFTRNLLREFSARGVCCFSEINDSLLMWGHYANGHRGFCLEFDTGSQVFEKLHPVKYSREIANVVLQDALTEDGLLRLFSAAVTTKSKEWSYEQEWRLLHSIPGTLHSYNASSLKAVYCGVEMPQQDFNRIWSLIEGSRTAIFRMKKHDDVFGIFPEPAWS